MQVFRVTTFQKRFKALPKAPAAPTIKMADARNRAIARGFTNDQFEEAIEEYEELNVFTVNAARTRLTVVTTNQTQLPLFLTQTYVLVSTAIPPNK